MQKLKLTQKTKKFILTLVSLLTCFSILITGVHSYAVMPDAAYLVKIQGNGLLLGQGASRNRQPARVQAQIRGNNILYVPGNGPWAYLGFIVDAPLDSAGLLVKAGPSSTPSEWSFPCTARGGFTIAWKRGSNRGCETGVKVQRSSNRSGIPNTNNNLLASRKLLAQAEDEVTVVPTLGESIIQTADTAAGININVLVGDVQVTSAKNPGGKLVKAGEQYDYPQDTITPIDTNPIVNSPEMQDFLNPNNWSSPDISQRVADGIAGQLGEMRTTLGLDSPAIASNSGDDNLSVASQPNSTSPDSSNRSEEATQKNSDEWILELPTYNTDPNTNCNNDSLRYVNIPLLLTGSSFSGESTWTRIYDGTQVTRTITGTITGNNVEITIQKPPEQAYPYRLNGSRNEKGDFEGMAQFSDGLCNGKSQPFKLRRNQ